MISSASDLHSGLSASGATMKAPAPERPVPVLVALSSAERARFFPDDLTRADYPVAIDWHTMPEKLSAPEWAALLSRIDPEVIVGGWKMPPLAGEMVGRCPSLRYLCYVAGSVRKKVDRSFIERGGVVSNWGDAVAPSVAECALMLTLMCLRQATRFALDLHVDRGWRTPGAPLPLGLYRRKVGIHGFGAVARALLRLLAPFGAQIEAFSEPVPETVFAAHGVRKAASLAALYRENDVVIVVEALTPLTRGSVDAAILAGLRPGAVLVNVGRGPIIDDPALEKLAARGEVQIGLDVFATEPLPPASPLRGLRNVTLLPHTAGPTIDWYPLCGRRALDNLRAWLAGGTPPDAVSLQRYDVST
ncbi:hydroxyacid dehydrogenase [Opitutaceae bacterium TAV5]|nr:hydroxyacid dehydrogenase [Opitutaceae bacterium TAV5]